MAEKVLIVEDSPTQALRTRIALESQGFQVVIVNDSKDALGTAKSEKPDIVFSDVRMPGLDGFQLLQALRADAETGALPVVLASATVNDEEDKEYALENGASDYVEKGLAPADLAGVLRRAMSG